MCDSVFNRESSGSYEYFSWDVGYELFGEFKDRTLTSLGIADRERVGRYGV